MLVHKAARHLVLAQARQAMRILQQAGYAASAAEIGLTADCLEFAAGDQGETADEVMDPLGKSFVVRVVAHGEVRLEKRVSAALFSFYRHGATDLSETGRDDVQEANAAAARSLFLEMHKARLGTAALDAATEKVLAGEMLPKLAGKDSDTPAMVWAGLIALCGLAFFLSTWQGTRVFNFIDTTYLIENLNQLAQGRIPYRDFFLVLPPLHYLLHLVPFQLSGGSVMALVYSGAAVQVVTVLATFWVCQTVVRSPWLNLLFAVIPAVMGMAMLGQPLYDSDAVLAVALAIGAILKAERGEGRRRWAWAFAAGIATGCTIMIKINIGLPLMVALVLAFGVGRLLYVQVSWRCLAVMLLGVALVLGGVGLWLASQGALEPMFAQVLAFPAKMRLSLFEKFTLSLPFQSRFDNYHYLAWAVLLAGLWLLPGVRWFAGSHRHPVSLLLPLVVLAVCLGTMQSQAYHSVYGLGPMAALTLTMWSQFWSKLVGRWGTLVIAPLALLLIGTAVVQDLRQGRLFFMEELLSEPYPFSEPHLRGVRGHAPTVTGFETAVAFAKKLVRPGESVFWWPGTAPFYLATGFANPLANFQVYPETGLSPEAAVAQLKRQRVQWVFVDHTARRIESFGRFYKVASLFNQDYQLYVLLGGVAVYRLKTE